MYIYNKLVSVDDANINVIEPNWGHAALLIIISK